MSFGVSVLNWGILFPHHRLFVKFIIYNIRFYIWEHKIIRVEINCTLVLALRLGTGRMTDKWIGGLVLLLLTTTLEETEVSVSRPVCSLTTRKSRYTLYSGLCGPQVRSGQVRIISPTPGFHAQSVQAVSNS